MKNNNIIYHNVDMIKPEFRGDRLFRYPEDVLANCNTHCRIMSYYACNCELRFVTNANSVYVTITSIMGDGNIVVYFGDYCQTQYKILSGETKTICINKPVMLTDGTSEEFFENCIYDPNVIRLHLHAFMAVVGDIEAPGGEIRPPEKSELPQKTMLAYGSSITHGACAASTNLCFAQTAARLLKSDIINKGVGGSCFAEGAVADWFSMRSDWDFAYIEIGINMLDKFECDEFEKRYTYFLNKMAETGKPIFAPSIYMYSGAFKDKSREKYRRFNEIIRNYHENCGFENVHFIDGDYILPESRWLSADGLHPSTEGHALMGMNIAKFIEKYI